MLKRIGYYVLLLIAVLAILLWPIALGDLIVWLTHYTPAGD